MRIALCRGHLASSHSCCLSIFRAKLEIVVLLALLTLSAAVAADESFRIAGPAGPDIVRYLSTTKVDCLDSDRKDCTISSILSDAETFYGKFPCDTADYVVTFVLTRTGGSSDNMMAVVLKGDTWGTFSLVGTAANIYGGDPREVRFGTGRTITWVGTITQPDDSHARPTGKKTLRLIVAENTVRFLDK
jgi:hypothetical protein